MKIQRLGIEWGAAFEEARPMLVRDLNGDTVEIFSREGYGLTIVTEGHISVHPQSDGKLMIEIYQSWDQ